MESETKSAKSALTGALELVTKELHTCMQESEKPDLAAWAAWLRLKMCGDTELEKLVGKVAQFGTALKQREWPPRWLSLVGNSGVGKTHCARRLFEWSCQHIACQLPCWPDFILWPEMIDSLRGSHQEYAYDKFNELRHWPFLVLDDVLAERDPSGFAAERLLNLLSSREQKWTVITTNLSMEQMASIEPRLASRMVRSLNIVCDINTIDFALRPK